MGSIVILKATIGKLDTAYAFLHTIDALLFGVSEQGTAKEPRSKRLSLPRAFRRSLAA
jgi:hypothetical protein